MTHHKRYGPILVLIVLSLIGTACQSRDLVDKLPAHEQKWTFTQGKLHSLVVDSEYDVSMAFIASADGSNYVEISGNMQQHTIDQLEATEIAGNTLKVELNKDVKLVAPNYKSTKLQMTVALADDTRLKQVSYKSKAGDASFTDLKAENIDVSFHSGDVKVDGLQGALTVEGTFGNITAADVDGSADVSLRTGQIKFDRFTGDGVFKLTSGSIDLTEQRSDHLDISVRTGDVTLSLDPAFKGFFDLKTTTGRVNAPEPPQETTDKIKVRATSGNILIR
ncbi:DUF4097 domain-containing protein [Cohnella ginsengisoli]|uniref:DUF4097 domain-containing protein n=1 Tax=Cohnella ginsengisoli TaxID=425004 RepID=A0A9X4QMZ7_9BACL|nr:DUF4097 family beta strand repeat-containing protein [Cohnella ginsengisoli]MDG0792273.1 DUF4097 domain-containing protein [Cohnella ginsengisoli]